jgi:hypothetical protein
VFPTGVSFHYRDLAELIIRVGVIQRDGVSNDLPLAPSIVIAETWVLDSILVQSTYLYPDTNSSAKSLSGVRLIGHFR